MQLRFARPQDSQALLDIYARYIRTPITFEYDLPTPEEFSRRIASTLERYPYLAVEEDGKLIGYAYAHPERERAAYQWNAELSIYLAPGAVGRGVGTALYSALMDLLRLQGVKTVYGVVTSPNPASEKLHQSLGFRLLGVHRNTGFKDGAWYDVLWFEKSLAGYEADPRPVIPIGDVPAREVRRVLDAFG
ncbi:GNAT family N-acetyltransferase [Pseudoflavonifractor phocaeensis]|uniref:GNAT family N-acetyltransferase n=1 Tax=Pseudoflavonifractor phocaeensis TaxID=1870988 RepID=UPI001F15DB00|nr:GNAT family N-acetyltransferase [Pseudoflavonifractor phocaeensis]